MILEDYVHHVKLVVRQWAPREIFLSMEGAYDVPQGPVEALNTAGNFFEVVESASCTMTKKKCRIPCRYL